MGTTAVEFCRLLHPVNPYEGFDPAPYPKDLQGGQLSPAMEHIFNSVRPRTLIEVGSWKGRSACFWANLMRQQGIDGVVVCVDTWLGGLEHIDTQDEWNIRQYYKHGYSTLYYQFLANVMHEGLQELIVPMPIGSVLAARWWMRRKLSADVVYLDGSHDEDDVFNDLCAYWPVLRPGGIICGDDFCAEWYSVICGVNRFSRHMNQSFKVGGSTWAIRKA